MVIPRIVSLRFRVRVIPNSWSNAPTLSETQELLIWSAKYTKLGISSYVRRDNLVDEEWNEILSILEESREDVRECSFPSLDGIDDLLNSSSAVLLERGSDGL